MLFGTDIYCQDVVCLNDVNSVLGWRWPTSEPDFPGLILLVGIPTNGFEPDFSGLVFGIGI